MKLYVWNNPYDVRYGHSLVFAVAENIEAAREQVLTGESYAYGEYTGDGVQKTKLDEPTRIVDLPCAEWHCWSE